MRERQARAGHRAVALQGPGRGRRRPSTWCATPARRRCSRRACGSRASRSRRPRRPSRPAARTIPPAPGSSRRRPACARRSRTWPRSSALDFDAARRAPDVQRHLVDLPRLAVLQTWSDTQSAGWVRMIFDDEKIPYTLIMDEDVRKGGLRERFDVILYPDTGAQPEGHRDRHRPALRAARLHEDAAVPEPRHAHRDRRTSPGGFGWTGIQNLEDFVRNGRRAGHARRRVDAAARRRHRARRPPRDRRRTSRTRAASCACASGGPTTRSPTATPRRPRSSARTSPSTPCGASTRAASCCSGARRSRRTTTTRRPTDETDEGQAEGAAARGERRRSRAATSSSASRRSSTSRSARAA